MFISINFFNTNHMSHHIRLKKKVYGWYTNLKQYFTIRIETTILKEVGLMYEHNIQIYISSNLVGFELFLFPLISNTWPLFWFFFFLVIIGAISYEAIALLKCIINSLSGHAGS